MIYQYNRVIPIYLGGDNFVKYYFTPNNRIKMKGCDKIDVNK